MADFRKWLFAFAVLALLLFVGAPAAHAQIGSAPAFVCSAQAGVTPLVRIEGVTELVGDVVLNCTGGTPTQANAAIPLTNVQVFLNTQITSRILSNGNSEATLTIDEPFPGGQTVAPSTATPVPNAPTVQTACAAINQVNCAEYGVGPFGLNGNVPATSYAQNPLGPIGSVGPYNGTGYNTIEPAVGEGGGTITVTNPGYNVFQGIQVSANQVDWLGVPIDPPGSNVNGVLNTRVIRITNVRGNICNIASGASSFIPFPVYMYISVNGSQQININNPQVTVAYLAQGLKGANTSAAYQQCYNLNGNLLQGATGQSGTLYAAAIEGFASSFKVRSYSQIVTPGAPDSPPSYQNVLGFPYNTESGFVANPNIPGEDVADFGLAPGDVGLADQGTEITFTITNVPVGVSLFAVAPTIPLYPSSQFSGFVASGSPSGLAVLVGSGALTISGGTATVTYEVVASNVNLFEELVVPVEAAYIVTGPTNPAPTTTSPTQVTINFAPAAGTNTTAANATVPIPRFCQPYTAANFFTINACSCNLLFPFVTNQAGFDTGIAIANTTADTLNGLAPQAGPVTLTYYGGTTGGGAAPATQVSQSVDAGNELVFTLSGGGNYGVVATPGFEGYIIARTNFQYCHAFAFISDMGAQKLAEGYLAIQLDLPVVTVTAGPTGLNRTGQAGENQGH